MKLTITCKSLGLVIFASSLQGCSSSFSTDSTLEIQMYGTIQAPSTATGDQNPDFQTYEITQVELITAAGSTPFLEESESYKIVDRAQQIFEYKMDDYEDQTFTGLTVTFGAEVIGGDASQPELSFTLTQPSAQLTKEFTIKKSKAYTFALKVLWGNTLADGAMTEPEFEITGP